MLFPQLHCSIKSSSFHSTQQIFIELSTVFEKDLDTALRKCTDQRMRQMNKQIISVQHGECNDRFVYKAALQASALMELWSGKRTRR